MEKDNNIIRITYIDRSNGSLSSLSNPISVCTKLTNLSALDIDGSDLYSSLNLFSINSFASKTSITTSPKLMEYLH
jgi:hypothetical protein